MGNLNRGLLITALFMAAIARGDDKSAEMNVYYPTSWPGKSRADTGTLPPVAMKVGAEIQGGQVVIRLSEHPDYKRKLQGRGYDLHEVVDGTHEDFRDSDSAQVAIRFKKGDQVLSEVTNASPSSEKKTKGNPAAFWNDLKVDENKLEQVRWNVDIPAGTTDIETIVIYTDVLGRTPTDAAREKALKSEKGDLPLIVGSFTMQNKGKDNWKVQTNPDDVNDTRKFPLGEDPTLGQLEETKDAVAQRLEAKTGFKLNARPKFLKQISHAQDDGQEKNIQDALEWAEAAGLVNRGKGRDIEVHDTGSDIAVKDKDDLLCEKKDKPWWLVTCAVKKENCLGYCSDGVVVRPGESDEARTHQYICDDSAASAVVLTATRDKANAGGPLTECKQAIIGICLGRNSALEAAKFDSGECRSVPVPAADTAKLAERARIKREREEKERKPDEGISGTPENTQSH